MPSPGERRCWRCDQPKSRHRPGPPSPPIIKGHLGATASAPGCCNAFQEPPADLEAQARMYRRQRDEYDREARRYRNALLEARRIIDRAVAEEPSLTTWRNGSLAVGSD